MPECPCGGLSQIKGLEALLKNYRGRDGTQALPRISHRNALDEQEPSFTADHDIEHEPTTI